MLEGKGGVVKLHSAQKLNYTDRSKKALIWFHIVCFLLSVLIFSFTYNVTGI